MIRHFLDKYMGISLRIWGQIYKSENVGPNWKNMGLNHDSTLSKGFSWKTVVVFPFLYFC